MSQLLPTHRSHEKRFSISQFYRNKMSRYILVVIISATIVSADYWSDRSQFIDLETSQSVGSQLVLSQKEQKVNTILMSHKFREYDAGFVDPQDFLPSVHFFQSKTRIEQSDVFKFIQKVPKGASLHSHDTALASFDYLFNLTYSDNLYACVIAERLLFRFFASADNATDECDWKSVIELRKQDPNFDRNVQGNFSIVTEDPIKTYPNINIVWAEFLKTFGSVNSMLTYRPLFEEYFYQALKELRDDNVMYLEFRSTLPALYDFDGTIYGPVEVAGIYASTTGKFRRDYPDFHGVRLIYAPSRSADNKTADEYVKIASQLKKRYPDFLAGFDLVGEEDRGRPLRDFIPQLLEISKEMKFFFHAAETDWNGVSTDFNLVDAVLLNTTRIGHGFGIVKHPRVMETVKTKQIAIEINPISNQVLKLVDDLRNHPGSHLIAAGYPVVICCDDPSFWGAKALSYDWYMAFMGLASRENDLKLLKQFAINSIVYSAMEEDEKQEALLKWENQWEDFLDSVLKEHYYDTYTVIKVNK